MVSEKALQKLKFQCIEYGAGRNHYVTTRKITEAMEECRRREIPAWATHFYGGDNAFMSPAARDQYQEIPK
jgi:hypothetical protein